MNDKFIDSFLSPSEKAAVEKFASDEVMFEAVKKVVLADVYYRGTLRKVVPAEPITNFALSLAINRTGKTTNEQLGEDLAAVTEGCRLVETGFKRAKGLAPVQEEGKSSEKKTPNPAR